MMLFPSGRAYTEEVRRLDNSATGNTTHETLVRLRIVAPNTDEWEAISTDRKRCPDLFESDSGDIQVQIIIALTIEQMDH